MNRLVGAIMKLLVFGAMFAISSTYVYAILWRGEPFALARLGPLLLFAFLAAYSALAIIGLILGAIRRSIDE